MKTYDTETSKEIHNLRLKDRIGPKPNANSHITFKGGFYGELVRYFIGKKEKK